MPDLVGHTRGRMSGTCGCSDRRRLYENLLVEGSPDMIDGPLLVDVWPEPRLPEKIRAAWAPWVKGAAAGQTWGVFQYDA